MAAMRLCLERLVPPLKSRDTAVIVPGFGESLADDAKVVVKAIGEGALTPDEGAAVLGAMASQGRIQEIYDFEQRLRALEVKSGKP